jgi:hypothetical protein
VHASALLAVAEAGTGELLLRALGHLAGFVPVVRKLDAKFRKPAQGRVAARCAVEPQVIPAWVEQLQQRGRLSVAISVEVLDVSNDVVLTATVEWFIAKERTHEQ